MLEMGPTERSNGRLGPLNEQIDKPMEEPEEAGTEARSPSPEYSDPMESEVLMEEAKEARAGARSPSPEYLAQGSRSPSREHRARSLVHETYYEPMQVDKS